MRTFPRFGTLAFMAKKQDRDSVEYQQLSRMRAPACWDHPLWQSVNKVDAVWVRDAWAGLARMARARVAAGVATSDADRLALSRVPEECYTVRYGIKP